MVCHEFRNPLNNIAFSVSSLLRYSRQLSRNKKNEYLLDIEANIDRMTQMTDELLVISKSDNESIDLKNDLLDLVELCQRLITEFEKTHEKSRIKFNCDLSELKVRIDERLLWSVIVNLLSNAVKYSPHQAEINLYLESFGDRFTVAIEDRGIGIPQPNKNRIHEPFYRGKNVSNIPGTGLGLHIVKKFVNILGGEIKISSQENHGTKVEVIILL